MKKQELITIINELNLPKSEYYILSSGSLLLYGLRDEANDIDLCVSYELFEKLKEKYNLTETDKNECDFYHISKLIEVIPNDKEDFKFDIKDGYQVEKLESILKYKQKRNSQKDQKDIEKIKKYLKQRNDLCI